LFRYISISKFTYFGQLISFQNFFNAPSEATAVIVGHGFSSTHNRNSSAEEQRAGDTLFQNQCTKHGGGHVYRPEAHSA
jgi:hypothetical protein